MINLARRFIAHWSFRAAFLILAAILTYGIVLYFAADQIWGVTPWSIEAPAYAGAAAVVCILLACWPEKPIKPIRRLRPPE